jgi:hypothetical protein
MRTPDNHNNTRLCRLADEPEAFQRLGLDTKSVATGGYDVRIADTWELMYFDHHLAR